METVALDAGGVVRWRVAHGDVIASAELVAGQLALTSYGGDVALLDPDWPQPAPVSGGRSRGAEPCGRAVDSAVPADTT